MDTNYFLKREQVSLMMAARAATPEARHAHAGLARLYGKMLSGQKFPHRQFRVMANGASDISENPDRGYADA